MGQIQGKGRCIYEDRSVYIGEMIEGKRQGFGKFIWYDGSFYEGNWRSDRIEGKGSFKNQNQEEISGIFKNNYLFKDGNFIKPFLPVSLHKKLINNLKQ